MRIVIRHEDVEDEEEGSKLGVQAIISSGNFTEEESANCAFVVDHGDVAGLLDMLQIGINNLIEYKLRGQHEERTSDHETGSTSGLEQAISS